MEVHITNTAINVLYFYGPEDNIPTNQARLKLEGG